MTGRMWVRTVDQIVQYTPEEGAATGRTVLTVHTASDWRHYLGPFVSERAALDFALRHLGPVVDPAGTVRANAAAVVLTIDVDAEAWAEHL